MSRLSRPVRGLVYATIAVVALIAFLFTAIHLEQYLLRKRAEHLAADIRTLQVRRSTFSQAAAIFASWSRYGLQSNPCGWEHCDFVIALDEAGEVRTPRGSIGWTQWGERLYRLAGGRLSSAYASISVRDGIVWYMDVALDVDVPPFRDAEGRTESYPLLAQLHTISRREPLDPSEIHYAGPDACTGCVGVWVTYTPYASPAEIATVGQINFACITQWRQCRTKQDIMPGAISSEIPSIIGDSDSFVPFESCGSKEVQSISRDAEEVAIADVLTVRKDQERIISPPAMFYVPMSFDVHLVQLLKPTTFFKAGDTANLAVVDPTVMSPARNIRNIKPGSRVLIVFDRILHHQVDINLMAEPCGVIPFSEERLSLVKSGVEQADNPASVWGKGSALPLPEPKYGWSGPVNMTRPPSRVKKP